MPAGPFVEEILIPAPVRGLFDRLDPASHDGLFPPDAASDLLNIRVTNGRWEVRAGSDLWKALPGSGDVRALWDFYESDGTRWRLAVRGSTTNGVFYDYEEGVDVAFQGTTNGTSLGGSTEPYFDGCALFDRFYFLDRQGALRSYTPSSPGVVATVTSPAAPTAAPVVIPRRYRYLDPFRGSAPFNWSESDSAEYQIVDATASHPSPLGGPTAGLEIRLSSAIGETIQKDVSADVMGSHTIAWYLKQTRNRYHQTFQIGITTDTDFEQPHRNPEEDQWFPVFFNIGNLPRINHKQFKVVNATVSFDYISRLVLPGKLSGHYVWMTTHYNSSTEKESEPSALSNAGANADFSVVGVTKDETGASHAAFKKAAALVLSTDNGVDNTTNKIRIYRSGGVPALTVDETGRRVWFRVGEVSDIQTTLSAPEAADELALSVTSSTGFAIGDTVVIEPGVAGKQEFCEVTGVSPGVLTIHEGTEFSHLSGAAVHMAFLDNVANEEVNTTATISLERDDAPTGAFWIDRTPDKRLIIFGWPAKPTGVAFSNRSTPERDNDHEVFPADVDPLTRQDTNQGFRAELYGDVNDEKIMWGKMWQGLPHFFTKRRLVRINAASQLDWGPQAFQPLLDVGCISGHTVAVVGGVLYWVAPGPCVYRFDGNSAPEDISKNRIEDTLRNAPSANYSQWFAAVQHRVDGLYYCLYMTPSGATTNTLRLDFNTSVREEGLWEPMRFVNAAGATLGMRAASVRHGHSDFHELYQVSTAADIYQTETGTNDDGAAIPIVATTKRFGMQALGRGHKLLIRGEPIADTVSLTVTAGGSEYGDNDEVYSLSLAGTGDQDRPVRLHRTLMGRWLEIAFSGTVDSGAVWREIALSYQPLRINRYSD